MNLDVETFENYIK